MSNDTSYKSRNVVLLYSNMNNTNRKKLLEGPILKSLFTLAVPIVLANILQAGYQLTDSFWVGRLGGGAVAAVSVSGPIAFLTIALGIGLAIAGSTLIAQNFGAKNYTMVNHVAGQTLLMIALVSTVLSIIGYLVAPTILTAMGVAPDIYPEALGFMRVSFIGLVFNFLFFMFQSIMRGVGEAKLPVYIVLGTVIFNFALDPLFIFGYGPVPAMGVTGAAIATVMTQSVAALIGLIILLGGKYGIHLSAKDFKPDFKFIKSAFMLGLPASIEQSARALGMVVITFLIASFGTLAIAAYGVGSIFVQVVIIPALGLSMAIATLVGQNIGAGNIKRAEEIGKIGSWIGFIVLTFFGGLTFLFARQLVMFFVPNDQPVIEAGTTFLRIMALSWGFIGLQMSLTGVFRAAGDMMTAMILALVSQWVLQFPLAYVLSKHTSLGIDGLWWSFTASNIITGIITIILYSRGKWKQSKLTTDERFAEKVSEEIITEEGVRS